jgi:glyoxylase-like metal-dependent hydrolase (beta-lactamase superfamily II)
LLIVALIVGFTERKDQLGIFGSPMIEIEKNGEIIKFRMARTVLGRGLYFTAAYWVDGLVVDTGCSYTEEEFVHALSNLPVKQIVNTHSHEDHVAANSSISQKHGAQIYAHEDAVPILANPGLNRLRPYQLVMWGRPKPSTASAIGDVVETDHHTFKVIRTPGHSLDHVCLYEPNTGWLFTGDTYVGGKDKSLRADYNIWQIIQSLKTLSMLDSSMLFPGSGTVRMNPRQDLLEKIDYLEETGSKVLDLQKKGWSRRRIRKTLFGPEMSIAYNTLGHFSGRNLVRSYIEDVTTIQKR